MQINNLVDITAQKFVTVVGFENVDFALVCQKSLSSLQLCVMVVNMVACGAS